MAIPIVFFSDSQEWWKKKNFVSSGCPRLVFYNSHGENPKNAACENLNKRYSNWCRLSSLKNRDGRFLLTRNCVSQLIILEPSKPKCTLRSRVYSPGPVLDSEKLMDFLTLLTKGKINPKELSKFLRFEALE